MNYFMAIWLVVDSKKTSLFAHLVDRFLNAWFHAIENF